jgi:2-hydroxy-3-keto-5-methylthiopentenyl-1-phosphate phosphatase
MIIIIVNMSTETYSPSRTPQPDILSFQPTEFLTRIAETKHLSLSDKIAAIHELTRPQVEATGLSQYLSGDQGALTSDVAEHLRSLFGTNQLLINTVSSPTINGRLDQIAANYREIDLTTTGQSWEERVKARTTLFNKAPHVVLDLDNTITDQTARKGNTDDLLLGSAICDPLIGADREYFPEVFAAVWKDLVRDFGDVFYEGGIKSPIREGVVDLFEFLKQNGIKTTILTTNFAPFVEGVISRLPYLDGLAVFSVNINSIVSTLKGELLQVLASRNPNRPLFFVGDGTSDKASLSAKSVVASFFALEGAGFQTTLTTNNTPHFTFRNGHDIIQTLANVT